MSIFDVDDCDKCGLSYRPKMDAECPWCWLKSEEKRINRKAKVKTFLVLLAYSAFLGLAYWLGLVVGEALS